MRFRYRSEEEMKDSGVEWIGKIPRDWNKGTLRWYLSCKSGDFISNTVLEKDEKSIPVIGGNGVMGYCDKYNVKNTVLAVGRVGALCGNVHLIDYPCWITDNSLIIHSISKKIYINYLHRMLRILNLNSFSTSTAQPLITGETIKKRFICIPTLHEQEKIANFLDAKTAQFDTIISKKEALIQTLEEAKKSLISEVVTGKVKVVKTSDGYELVEREKEEMKDSGVEWLGDIPKEWDVSKVKYNTYVKGRIGWQGLKADEFIENGPYLVTGTNFNSGSVEWSKCYHISKERFEEAPEIQLKNNDLLITKDGTIGKLAIVEGCPEYAILNSGIFVTRCINNKYITKYMYYLLSSEAFKTYIELTSIGSTIQHLYQYTFVNFIYTLPSIDEQNIIVDILNRRTEKMDKLINKIILEIKKLKEAKQSLISEAVTGKIEILD